MDWRSPTCRSLLCAGFPPSACFSRISPHRRSFDSSLCARQWVTSCIGQYAAAAAVRVVVEMVAIGLLVGRWKSTQVWAVTLKRRAVCAATDVDMTAPQCEQLRDCHFSDRARRCRRCTRVPCVARAQHVRQAPHAHSDQSSYERHLQLTRGLTARADQCEMGSTPVLLGEWMCGRRIRLRGRQQFCMRCSDKGFSSFCGFSGFSRFSGK